MAYRLPISLACWDYDRTRALREGTVRPAGVDLTYLPLPPEETFFRMLRWQEFDVAEMSLSSYVLSLFADEPPFVAIPVFPSRVFRHGSIYLAPSSTVRDPAELAGRTVGIPEYQMTAAVWIRGVLAEHHGLPVDGVRYRTGGLHHAGRQEKLRLDLPERFDVTPIRSDETLDGLLRTGAIDALYTARAPRSFDPAGGPDRVRRLFSDPAAAERAYLRATGIFPIMHTVVLRRDVYQRHRWLARALLDAFAEARDRVYAELREVTALKISLPWVVPAAEEAAALLGHDFWPYGVEPNHGVLETFLRYSHEQGLARRLLEPTELFAPETLADTLV
ncbi:ABC transporter substrate-binding protein [Solwaraspora sp. WMMA2101]|uniref:ABC transporter substrate-binding protein n=1 Tax=Solwaraspora sp. WMMA2101 TaxID=3404124 RepID=UPI003B92AFD4